MFNFVDRQSFQMENKKSCCPFHSINHIKELDALDPEARANPWPYYDWLRNDPQRAVYAVPHESSFYMLHQYEDVKQTFADAKSFSNKIIPTVKSPFFALIGRRRSPTHSDCNFYCFYA